MPRMLGDAFVVISPDAGGFRSMADAQIRRALAGLKPVVRVGADVAGANRAIGDLSARMAALSGKLSRLKVTIDDKSVLASISRMQAKLLALTRDIAKVTMQADTTKLDAAIAAEKAKLAALKRAASTLQLDADTARAAAKIAMLQRQASRLYDSLDKLTADVDIDAAIAKIYAIEAELRVLMSNAKAVEIAARTTEINAQIAAVSASIARLQAQARDIRMGIDARGLLAAEAQVLGLESATAKLAAAAGGAGRQFGALGAVVAGAGWGATIAGFKAWHLVLDLIVEGLIIAVSSMAALGAAFAATYKAVDQLGIYLKSSLSAMTALGVDAGPLAGKLDKLQKAMAPQVIEAYGGALALVNGQTGILNKLAPQVVEMINTWIAKIDLWAAGQRTFGGLIRSGASFLDQLAKIIGTVGQAISNLLTKDPGVAHFLLSFVQGIASLINIFSRLPAPIVEGTLALHGLYLWSKVLVIAPLLSFAKGLGILTAAQYDAAKATLTFRGALTFFLTNPFGWAILAAAAIAGLVYELTQASTYAKNFTASLEQGLSGLTASQQILQISSDVGQLRNQIDQVPARVGNLELTLVDAASASRKFWDQSQQDALLSAKQFTDLGKSAVYAIKAFFGWSSIGPQIAQTKNDVSQFTGEIIKLTGEQDRLFSVTGRLVSGQNDLKIGALSLSQAWGLMDIAGVQAGDKFDVMWQKVENLVHGYQAMSITSGILANSVNALTFATLQQDSKVSELNSAWNTFFSTVSGGESGFVGFATQVQGLYQSLGQVTSQVRVSSGRVTISLAGQSRAARTSAASMTGLNAASLNARNTFLQTASAANTQLDSLTLLASAAGLGARGTALLTQATKDMLASMLPAAKGSQVMTDVLYALAQRGGYQGADSFRALAQWVGNTKDPMSSLDKIVTTLTTAAANLTKDVQNLSLALGQTLNQAMASAIFQAQGGQKVFDAFANAVLHTGFDSKQTQTSALALAQSLYGMTGNVSDAKSEFEAFAQKGLGLTKTQADILWQQTLPALQKVIDGLHGTTIDIQMNGLGQYTITGSVISRSQGRGGSGNAAGGLAGGGLIHTGTGPTADDVLIRVSKGETVVSAAHSKALAGAFGAVGVPGYASGGPVGSGRDVLSGQYALTMSNAFQSQMTDSMVSAMRSTLRASEGMRVPGFQDGGLIGALLGGFGFGGFGGFGGLMQLLAGLMSGGAQTVPGLGGGYAGQANAAAGYPGLASVAGFGLTRSDLGLPAQAPSSSSSSSSSAADSAAAGSSPASAAKPASRGSTAAGRAAIAVLERLMRGYISRNELGSMRQANALLDWLGTGTYDARVSEIGFLDSLLVAYQKSRNKTAVKATLRLLASYGVHGSTPQLTAKGNAPRAAVISRMAHLLKADIIPDDMPAAGQANAILTALGVGRYTAELNTISSLNQLLARYEKAKDKADIAATETLLRQYGVRTFRPGSTVSGAAGSAAAAVAAAGAPAAGSANTIAGLRGQLAGGQATELFAYQALVNAYAAGLVHPAAGSYLATHAVSLAGELTTLSRRQASEQAAYAALAGAGLTSPNMRHLVSTLREEARTTQDKYLSTGEPGRDSALAGKIAALISIASQPVPAHARGGLIMDRGGYLAPGWNPPVWNGTGRPEPVGPAIGASDPAMLAELRRQNQLLEQLVHVSNSAPARTGEHVAAAVHGAAGAAAFRARYPSRGW